MKKKGDSSMIQGEGVVVGILRCALKGGKFFFLSCAYFSFRILLGGAQSEKEEGFSDFKPPSPRGGGGNLNQLIL